MPPPYQVFTIYAREDAQYLEELRGQLRPLEIGGRIKVWSDREINPGVDWEQEIVHHLDTADIILILVSSAYYNSVYIHEKEIKYALARHEKGEAKVLPIIVRPCSFGDDPVISRLQVLPTDGKPVTDKHSWPERDNAWLDVINGLKRTLQLLDDVEKHRVQAEQETQEAKARSDRKRREAEKRKSEEKTQREQAERDRRAHQEAWQQAADAHQIQAYEHYLVQYPQGDMAREARLRLKELKRKQATPLHWGRYTAIGSGVVALLLAIWWLPKLFGGEKEPQGVRTFSPSSLPEGVGVKQAIPADPAMVAIKGGTFDMGDIFGEGGADEKPVHSVTLKDFYLGKTEVTVKEYMQFVNESNSHAPEWEEPGNVYNIQTGTNDYYKKMGKALTSDNHPIVGISWLDAVAYCNWLSTKRYRTPCYTINGTKVTCKWNANGYRLPTEAEWEYAARSGGAREKWAGTSDEKGLTRFSNINGKVDGYEYTAPVASFKANSMGLFDMSGNVWEWCWDLKGDYSAASQTNPTGLQTGSARVLRGGGWGGDPRDCRSAYRYGSGPGERINYFGFRLALQ